MREFRAEWGSRTIVRGVSREHRSGSRAVPVDAWSRAGTFCIFWSGWRGRSSCPSLVRWVRRALAAWLGEPTPDNPEIRDPGLLKLFFSELATEDEFRALAHEQAAVHRSLLSRHESLWQRYRERPEYARRNLPLRWGLRMERALVDFWQELADERSPTAGRPRRKSTPR